MSDENWGAANEVVHVRFAQAPLLDNLGLRINFIELEMWPLYRYAIWGMKGRGRVSRWWCRRVRPWLMPKRQAEAAEAYAVARKMWKQALMVEVLGMGSDK